MQPNTHGKHVIDDETLLKEAIRKGAKSKSKKTDRHVNKSQESERINVSRFGINFTFNLSSPPQIDIERSAKLAMYHIRAFYYFITYNDVKQIGYFWEGTFMVIVQATRSDWGNPILIEFMNKTINKSHILKSINADGFFKVIIRKHKNQICWSWALEWNHNYRLAGFFGDQKYISELIKEFPKLEYNLIENSPKKIIRQRKQVKLKVEDDKLFEV